MKPHEDKEFYVGYTEKAPPGIAKYVRLHVILMLLAVAATSLVLVMSQRPPDPGVFEFGTYRNFEGWIVEEPFPMLRMERPGRAYQSPTHSLYTLVVFGKFSANNAVKGLNGKKVRLKGSMIYRDDQIMLEVSDDPIEVLEDPGFPKDDLFGRDLGKITLAGEIVDSKCFLGVMKPGNLKVHKACAVRCISGGIPPALVVKDKEGNARYFILVSPEGRAMNKEVLDMVAEPVRVTGKAVGYDNLTLLYTDPRDIVITR
ncbi:MAG: hypothetical protein QNK37_33720 [Acidobacteriota bacterium]|nr:hypothetical protein [Acidobacteriota bacterium]